MRHHSSRKIWQHRSCVMSAVACACALLAIVLAGCTNARTSAPREESTTASGAFSLTYVAIGASDAFGMGTDVPDRQSWPTVLAGALGPHVHLVNLGVPGTTTAQALQTELPVALDAQPAIVTVWIGVNDLLDGVPLAAYRAQLHSLLASLREHTRARIVAGNLPDLTALPAFYGADPAAMRATLNVWNAAIAQVCREEGVTLVDLYAGWHEIAQHPEYVSGDGFHPSAAGARRIAQIFAAALTTTAGSTPP